MTKQEIILKPRNLPTKQEPEKDTLVVAMEEVGINEDLIAKELKNIIDNAITATHKGDMIEDFATKLNAIKTWRKFQKDTPDVQIQIANIFQTGENIL